MRQAEGQAELQLTLAIARRFRTRSEVTPQRIRSTIAHTPAAVVSWIADRRTPQTSAPWILRAKVMTEAIDRGLDAIGALPGVDKTQSSLVLSVTFDRS